MQIWICFHLKNQVHKFLHSNSWPGHMACAFSRLTWPVEFAAASSHQQTWRQSVGCSLTLGLLCFFFDIHVNPRSIRVCSHLTFLPATTSTVPFLDGCVPLPYVRALAEAKFMSYVVTVVVVASTHPHTTHTCEGCLTVPVTSLHSHRGLYSDCSQSSTYHTSLSLII